MARFSKALKKDMQEVGEGENIIYPIALSCGTVITIRNVPVKLKRKDADKIARVIRALA